MRIRSMIGVFESLPDRPLQVEDYKMLDASPAPIRLLPVS